MPNKISIFLNFITACLLMVGCQNDEIITIDSYSVLCKRYGNDKFALCFSTQVPGSQPKETTEAIFDGTFEKLNINAIKNSDEMYILHAGNEKYLSMHGTLLLDGHSFSTYQKDNAGGVYFQTNAGKFFMTEKKGLPKIVDDYIRFGNRLDTFIFQLDGKWGIYQCFVKSGTNIFQDPVLEYVRIAPAIYDKIRYVTGDGAGHFIVESDGKSKIIDYYGRERFMVGYGYGDYQLNIYSKNGSSEGLINNQYIRKIYDISTSSKNTYIPYFRTECTYVGNKEAGIIHLKSHSDSYARFFTSSGDYSTFSLPWDEYDYHDLYHL